MTNTPAYYDTELLELTVLGTYVGITTFSCSRYLIFSSVEKMNNI